jgi:hypothetical protein
LHGLIVGDSPDFVDATRGLLERHGIVVVGVASSGAGVSAAAIRNLVHGSAGI